MLDKTPYITGKEGFNSRTMLLLATVYTFVLVLFFAVFHLPYFEALRTDAWPIIPTMALGSFVAGSTFLGGGAVAFPVMTKIMGIDPTLAKQFSLAIQSVGMSSASLLIILLNRKLPYRLIAIATAFAALGVVLNLQFAENLLTTPDLKIGFSLFVLCFLVVSKLSSSPPSVNYRPHSPALYPAQSLLILFSFLGGWVAGFIGSGADLFSFCIFFLLCRLPLKTAIQSSVLVMAGCSLIAVLYLYLTQSFISQPSKPLVDPVDLVSLWLLAAPVVLVGAPIGVLFCRTVSIKTLNVFIYTIALLELCSTIVLVDISADRAPYYLGITVLAITVFLMLKVYGLKLTTRD